MNLIQVCESQLSRLGNNKSLKYSGNIKVENQSETRKTPWHLERRGTLSKQVGARVSAVHSRSLRLGQEDSFQIQAICWCQWA